MEEQINETSFENEEENICSKEENFKNGTSERKLSLWEYFSKSDRKLNIIIVFIITAFSTNNYVGVLQILVSIKIFYYYFLL